MAFTAECIKSDKRRREAGAWARWMEEAARYCSQFYNEWGDDPFSFSEKTSVAFLGASAAKIGFLALSEFRIDKTSIVDRRRSAPGQADLWLYGEERDWWFEFKQVQAKRGSLRDLERAWEKAEICARQVKSQGVAVAGLVISLSWIKDSDNGRTDRISETIDVVNAFIENRQFVWRFKDRDNTSETYVVLQIVKD